MEKVIDLKNTIDLDNKYYLKVVNRNDEVLDKTMNIKKLKFDTILKKEKILLSIDFNSFDRKQYNNYNWFERSCKCYT